MSLRLQFVFIGASIFTFIFVIRKIRKQGLNINQSIVWILWAIVLLILSVFPGLALWISNQLGFMSTSNFIFSLFIFFLYIITFSQASELSKVQDKNKELIQKLSIKEYLEEQEKK